MARLFRQFSTIGGVPSHVGPTTPGSIHEGGELGYVLTHAFGAVFDNPDAGDAELELPAGSGARGVVNEAEHVHIHRRVAVKLLRHQFATNPNVIKRLEREAQLTSELTSKARTGTLTQSMARAVRLVLDPAVAGAPCCTTSGSA